MFRRHRVPVGTRQHGKAKHLQDVMTRNPVCCLPSETAQHAAAIMRERDTGIVPVVESAQQPRLIGVVTDRDLCLGIIAEGRDPRQVRVQDCMTARVICASPVDDVQKAVVLMEEYQVRRIPVVDESRRIQGILSLGDVARRSGLSPQQTHEALAKISAPTPTLFKRSKAGPAASPAPGTSG